MSDLISRKAAIDALKAMAVPRYKDPACEDMWERDRTLDNAIAIMRDLPSAQQWIPFETRPLTEEEQNEHPEWDCIMDCKLPDDGQRILVSINLRGHEAVQQDEFYSDDGSYLDSGYEIGTEAVAWMPLPEPWRGEE